jgi:hypothetical protein
MGISHIEEYAVRALVVQHVHIIVLQTRNTLTVQDGGTLTSWLHGLEVDTCDGNVSSLRSIFVIECPLIS